MTSSRHYTIIASLATLGLLAIGCTTPPPAVEDYPTASARVIEVGGVNIHYFDFHPDAEGIPIVWLHGYSGSAFETYYFYEELGSEYRLIAPDLPGSGFSEKPEREYTLDYFVGFVNEFTELLGLTEFILVGHSMGGLVASAVAAEHPAGLEKLVLVAPYGLAGQAGAIPEFLASTGVLVDYGLELHNETLIDLAIRANVFHNTDRIPQDLIDYTKMSTFHTDNAIPALASVTRNVIAAEHDPTILDRVDVPTLIIWGANDRVLDFRYAATFNRRIAGSVLQAIPDCGHLPHVEYPRVTAEIIRRFLD